MYSTVEMSLAIQLVDSDPGEAVKVAEQTLDHGFPAELITVVGQLLQKDKESGNKLLGILISKLRAENLSQNEDASSLAGGILCLILGKPVVLGASVGMPGPPVADERLIRELMEIVLAAALSPPSSSKAADAESDDEDDEDEDGDVDSILSRLRTMLPEVQRYAPSRYSAVKARIDEEDRKLSPKERAMIE